ncbi:hypothetical protein L3X38_025212 [Prunus dulcis]|uniref:Integrase catalytic domain-containing protein n=1 Tax=Prunus dulcis TaxID=3755 RepID=A0AAD4Z785_PRUDU|nr:hypothetical protein L3X38_025212 [Prunus dulcis]
MMKDCTNYSKGCEACQRHGPIQQAPSVCMNPVVKPWPFRGWAMDLIGKIYPASSQQHCFIIVATDYFTKWVEAKPIKTTTSQEIITFVEEQIIQRFGIQESITTDRGSSFISRDMLDMAETFKFKLLQSTPYYAQANGQAESSNKVIINIIRKMLEKNPKQWHEKLSETLWAYRTSKREATGMNPYALTYGHDAILPMEIAVQSLRIAHQHSLTGEDYSQAMLLELEELDASLAFGSFGRCPAPRKCVFLRHGRRRGCLGASRFDAGSARPWKCVFLRHGRRRGCLGASRFVAGTARFIMV